MSEVYSTVKVTNENFEEIISSNDYVLVDFFAKWSGPCKMLSKAIDEVGKETDVVVARCDVDECMDLTNDLAIDGVPAVCLYKNGEQIYKAVGLITKSQIENLVIKNKG